MKSTRQLDRTVKILIVSLFTSVENNESSYFLMDTLMWFFLFNTFKFRKELRIYTVSKKKGNK